MGLLLSFCHSMTEEKLIWTYAWCFTVQREAGEEVAISQILQLSITRKFTCLGKPRNSTLWLYLLIHSLLSVLHCHAFFFFFC